MSEGDDGTLELDEGVVEVGIFFVTNDQPAEVARLGKGAFDFPAVAIATQLWAASSVLNRSPPYARSAMIRVILRRCRGATALSVCSAKVTSAGLAPRTRLP